MKPSSLEDVAGAILDGTAVDWPSVDSGSNQTESPLIEQLKTLAKLRLVSTRGDERQWGHLRLFERIGQGAFGDVYRAWDTRLDREVALKLLPIGPLEAGHSEDASSIIEEGRLLARVRHPNVVTIYGAERINGRVGLWMELIKGRTLEQALRDGTTFSAKEVERIGVELCRAVAAVHSAGLLHRDIKAQNVMVADDGRVVLMDFGTGRELHDAADGSVSGTPLYLAPEVLAGGAATARCDVYSVGVLLYHLATGSYPVQAADLAALRRAHAARQQPDLPAAGLVMPARLRRIVARALDPDPQRRYDTADSLGAALSALERVPAPLRLAYSAGVVVAVVATVASVAWTQRAASLAESQATTAADVAPASVPVIAVLPFKNLSSEPDSDYFADGLTSEVIRNLAIIDGLQVRSQTSSFFFKDKAHDLPAIGEQLHVNFIVEADVFRVGKQLRVNAQLVPVKGDVPLWSKQFEKTLDDVFAIQDEISLAIVNNLRVALGRGQRRYQTNPDAYEVYLRARAVIAGKGEDRGADAAIKLFKQVIAIDPSFAPAYAGLASAYMSVAWNFGVRLPPDTRTAARKALDLDPRLAEAYVAMGLVYTEDRDWQSAVQSFQHALELSPNLTEIHRAYSDTLLLMGQPQRAVNLLEEARSMDPLSPAVQRDLGYAQFVNGRYEEAVTNLRGVNARGANLLLSRALMMAGRPEEAIAVGKATSYERWLARAYVMTGRLKEFERLAAINRRETSALRHYHRAIIYAGLGDKDRTLEALGRAADPDPDRTASILLNPEMKFLVGDPRYDALKKKLRLP